MRFSVTTGLLTGEFAGLAEHDFRPGLFLDAVLEPWCARCHVVAGRAEQDGDLALAAGRLDHLVRGPLAWLDEVGADEAHIVLAGAGVDLAVDRHDRDVFGGRGAQHRLQPSELSGR